ncbi:hypothetical protein C2E25_03415 [Geothermobacter hydrogeniphilus]|uniref:Protease n=1 Tax=Geothermobacter hydrogeniphilus TaxID=1969733 RepID=A0A2K2HCX8_9BACT|nr:U32 family peptidase [Geothermobacter hydrogeniphilus]PNU21093.1 hypothetical protein C2E25_03415 [Geothermobacter hydrogeniphilus]
MKLISPIDSPDELEPLLAAGADELYGGVIPPNWPQGHGSLAAVNQRTFSGAQFDDFSCFQQAVSACHQAGRNFYLTLNSPFYTEPQWPLLIALVEQSAVVGLHGVILADLGLLRVLHRRFPELKFHASTLAHLGNSEAVRVYQRAGISSVVLPRHLSVAEMAAVAGDVPEVGCDAFLLVGKCPNTEGLCSFHHSSPDKIWPCEIPYEINPMDEHPSAVIEAAVKRQRSWSKSNRRHGCGLCAIPHLRAGGIRGLKLVGRGAPTAMKLANLALARDFVKLAAENLPGEEYRRRARQAHRRRFGAGCSPNVCYYPEFYQGE